MTLKAQLSERIRVSGPITVAEYMSECLLHPEHGYYVKHDPLGRQGDFVTAPEISQMFGELVGLALAQAWLDHGRPPNITLAELGPGRGTLMADALRATKSVPGFHPAARIVLVEASPALRTKQAEALAEHAPAWVDSADELPQTPLYLIANEFFDALPTRQFIRDGDAWRERLIGLDDGILHFGLGTKSDQPALAHRLDDTGDGDLVEHSASAIHTAEVIAGRIAAHGGAALIVDYGDWRSLGDTFQALRTHSPEDPLANPGNADLTAHVDFECIADAARAAGCAHSRLTTQGVFLERLGLTARAQALAKNLDQTGIESLIQAHRRLTHPDEMGNLFKVLGLFHPANAAPPGLEP